MLEIGKEWISFPKFSYFPANVSFRSVTIILLSNQLHQIQSFNFNHFLKKQLIASTILFEFICDHFDRKKLSSILDHISIFNNNFNKSSKIEFSIVSRDDAVNENLKFLKLIGKWLSLNDSSKELLRKICFRNSGSTKEYFAAEIEVQYELNCIINNGWFLKFFNLQ